MQQELFTDTDWVQIASGATACSVQAVGSTIEVSYSLTDPGAGGIGFDLTDNIPVDLPHVAAYGGSVWARSTIGRGGIRYVTA